MKTFVLAGVGLPGAMLVALAARTIRTSHETPSKAVHLTQLLYGADEYWKRRLPRRRTATVKPAQVSCGAVADAPT